MAEVIVWAAVRWYLTYRYRKRLLNVLAGRVSAAWNALQAFRDYRPFLRVRVVHINLELARSGPTEGMPS